MVLLVLLKRALSMKVLLVSGVRMRILEHVPGFSDAGNYEKCGQAAMQNVDESSNAAQQREREAYVQHLFDNSPLPAGKEVVLADVLLVVFGCVT